MESETKYSIIPKFSEKPIMVVDFVFCIEGQTCEEFIRFIDSNGCIGKIREADVGIILILKPSKEDLDDFVRLKRESEQTEKRDTKNDELYV